MIRLSKAILIRFGKFCDYTLHFSDGFQVIFGENEAGKSTIQLFLKVMFYGINGGKKDRKGMKIRERIIPWEEKSAEGILQIEVDGRFVEIRRKFGKTSSGDKTEVVDFNTGEPISNIDIREVGEQFLGIPESIFEKTLWLQQSGAAFSGTDEELGKRLMNLMETGAEEISAAGVLKELENEKRMVKAKDKRSVPGELDRLWSLREEKIQERYRLLSERNQREAEENVLKHESQKLEKFKEEEVRLQELLEKKQEILVLESLRKKWSEAEKFAALAKQVEEREEYQRFLHLEENVVQNAENLEKQREMLDQSCSIEYDITKEEEMVLKENRTKKVFSFLLMTAVVCVVLAIVFAVLKISFRGFWTSLLGCIGIVVAIISFLKIQQAKAFAREAVERRKGHLVHKKRIEEEFEKVQTEYVRILSQFGCKNVAELREGFLLCKQAKLELEGYKRTYESIMDGEDASTLFEKIREIDLTLVKHEDILAQDIEMELKKVRQAQIDCVARLKETESKLSYVFRGGTNPADVETEILQINQKINEFEKRQKALDLAIEVFGQVAEKRKSDFTPKVNERVNRFLGILTEGKYQDVRVSEEYQLRLIPDKGHLYQAEFFSEGTYDQIYFALRLSLASLLGDGTEPLFLDDFLMSYDDKRADMAMQLLMQLAETHQILFFSCHGRDVDNAKKRNVIIRYLEEERNDGC